MVSRRRILSAAALGVTGLSGCASLGDGSGDAEGGTPTQTTVRTTSGPAQFEEVSIEAPAEATVDESLEIAVSAANGGGEVGTFEATLQITGPEQRTESVTIADVQPGDPGETTVELDPSYAGTYTARLEGTDASAAVTVQSREAPVGETVALADDLRVRVDTVRIESSLIAEGQGPQYLAPPVPSVLPVEDPRETVLVVVRGKAQNAGDKPRTFDPAGLSIEVGGDVDPSLSFYADMGQEISAGVPIGGADLEGQPLAGADLDPGEERVGWLLAPIPREVATRAGITVAVQRDDAGPPEVRWDAGPESGTALPAFEAANLSVPDAVTNGTTAEFSLEVTNTGEAAGTFQDVLDISAIVPDLAPVGRIWGEVPPGETVELTGEFVMAWQGKQGLRLQRSTVEPATEVKGISFHATCDGSWAELGYGESATLTNGVKVNISSPVYSDNGFDFGDPDFSISGNYLVVAVTATLPEAVRGEGVGDELLPSLEELTYLFHEEAGPVPSQRARSELHRQRARENDNTLEYPVDGKLYPVTPPSDPTDGSVQGWVVFTNPSDDGLPDEEREIILEQPLKTAEGESLIKTNRIKWSPKFE